MVGVWAAGEVREVGDGEDEGGVGVMGGVEKEVWEGEMGMEVTEKGKDVVGKGGLDGVLGGGGLGGCVGSLGGEVVCEMKKVVWGRGKEMVE